MSASEFSVPRTDGRRCRTCPKCRPKRRARALRWRPGPLAEDLPAATAGLDLDGDEVPRPAHDIEPDAPHARDLGVHAGVVVSEEADPRVRARDDVCEPGGLAHVAALASVASLLNELDAGGRVVQQQGIDTIACAEPFDLVARVVAARVALEVPRLPPVVGGAVASSEAADPHRAPPLAEVDRVPVGQEGQAGQDLLALAFLKPREVLVVALDEHGRTRHGATRREPRGEVARALVVSRRAVDPLRVRPHAEVADVDDPLEAHAERALEAEDVLVEAVERSVGPP